MDTCVSSTLATVHNAVMNMGGQNTIQFWEKKKNQNPESWVKINWMKIKYQILL